MVVPAPGPAYRLSAACFVIASVDDGRPPRRLRHATPRSGRTARKPVLDGGQPRRTRRFDIVAKTRIAATSARIDAADAPAAIWTLMRFQAPLCTALDDDATDAAHVCALANLWLPSCTADAADLTNTCAGRLTLKGYVSGKDPSNGKDPATTRRHFNSFTAVFVLANSSSYDFSVKLTGSRFKKGLQSRRWPTGNSNWIEIRHPRRLVTARARYRSPLPTPRRRFACSAAADPNLLLIISGRK